MDWSKPGLHVFPHLPELAQTHVHWISDAIQPFCPLSSTSPLTFYLSQHQSLFQWDSFSHQMDFNFIDLDFSFSISLCNEYSGLISLGFTGLISWQFKGLTSVFSSSTAQKHQFFDTQPSLWSKSYIYTYTTGKTIALIIWTFVSKIMSLVFNILSRFVIAFLPRSKGLLNLWLSHHLQ